MAQDRLIYLPLGGAGEVGMNSYLYGYGPENEERFVLVDLGVTFPDMSGSPGVDLILPDVSWLEARSDQLEAIFITHAHEDHVGAVGHLYEKLRAPIYARSFTAHIARMKLEDHGFSGDMVQVVEPREPVKAGPFSVEFLPVSHSIPESSAVILDAPAGRLVHTGDFKLDETPGLGEPFDPEAWSSLGDVRAMICDSTNVFASHPGRSEMTVGPSLTKLIENASGMVAATTFASNIARVRTIANAGIAAGRSVVLLGRAMKRMISAAVETGILTDFPATVSPEDAADIPRNNLLLITTGSQGERRAATAQLSRGKFMGFTMQEGDLVLMSSKTIPGNEREVLRVVNNFSEKGVDVIDDSMADIHVSGHANRPDLERLHQMVKANMLIPMHGEHRMLREHARLAEENGFASAVAVNGTMLRLDGARPDAVEYIEAGRIYLDGSKQIGALDGIIRDRIRMAINGLIVAGVLFDDEDEPLEPWVEIRGLAESSTNDLPLAEIIEDDIYQALGRAKRKSLKSDDDVEEIVTRAARQSVTSQIGKKPEVAVLVMRLG